MYQVPKQIMETQYIKVPKVRYEAVYYEEEQTIQVPCMTYETRTGTPPRTVGLGLLLVNQNFTGRTYVEEIVPGFAAYRSGQFKVSAHTHTTRTRTRTKLRISSLQTCVNVPPWVHAHIALHVDSACVHVDGRRFSFC